MKPCYWCGGEKQPGDRKVCSTCKASDQITCKQCGHTKARSAFSDDRRQASGKQPYCRQCQGNRVRDRKLVRVFGLQPGDYDRLMDVQGGRCAICRSRPPKGRRFAVDHDHRTGEVRGLLCPVKCNYRLLGGFGDNPALYQGAADYLTSPPSRTAFDSPRFTPDAPPPASHEPGRPFHKDKETA